MLTEPVTSSESLRPPPSLEHRAELLRDRGIVQFARGREADLDSGFCLGRPQDRADGRLKGNLSAA